MRVIVPIHLGRISPLLDTARRALVLEIQDAHVAQRSEFDLPGDGEAVQAEALVASGAQRVVCGAVSSGLMNEMLWRGLQVWSGVAGEIDEVIASLLAHGRPDEVLMMPGCGGRRRGGGCGRGGGRHRWGWQTASGDANESEPHERKARGKRFQKGGQNNARW